MSTSMMDGPFSRRWRLLQPRLGGARAADRGERLARWLGFIGTPQFEELFDKLFGDVAEQTLRNGFSMFVPDDDDQDVGRNQNQDDGFQWTTNEYECELDEVETEEGQEPDGEDVADSDGETAEESAEESDEVPPSIFDLMDRGDKFEDMYSIKEEKPLKDPNVFIANRLTFLIQTMHPIIFDTSIIETGVHANVNYMSIAVNTDKTYPKVETVNDIAWVMRECNGSSEIRNEINEFLEGTEYGDICIFPSTIKRNGQEIPAVRFVIYPKRKNHNFGPAFLNHSR